MTHDSHIPLTGVTPMVLSGMPSGGVLTLYGSAVAGGGQPQWGRPDGDLDPEGEGHVAHTGPSPTTEETVSRALHRPVHLAHPVDAAASNLFPTAEV